MLFLNVQDEFHVPLKCNVVRWEKAGNGSDGFRLAPRLWHAFGILYLCGTETEPINRVIKCFNVYLPI